MYIIFMKGKDSGWIVNLKNLEGKILFFPKSVFYELLFKRLSSMVNTLVERALISGFPAVLCKRGIFQEFCLGPRSSMAVYVSTLSPAPHARATTKLMLYTESWRSQRNHCVSPPFWERWGTQSKAYTENPRNEPRPSPGLRVKGPMSQTRSIILLWPQAQHWTLRASVWLIIKMATIECVSPIYALCWFGFEYLIN